MLPPIRAVLLIVIIGLYYYSDVSLMRHFDPQRASQRKSARSWSFTLGALAFGIIAVVQPLLFPQWTWFDHPAFPVVGTLLSICALLLIRWARLHLGRFFFEGEETQEGHTLVETGPYRYVRHPLYTSFFLLATGTFLINPSLIMLVACLYTYMDFTRASRRDETLLLASLPDYAAYMARTPRFFPRFWAARK
jgi:protein-S-isoprenylcysteine O-methyltransferase Ste14